MRRKLRRFGGAQAAQRDRGVCRGETICGTGVTRPWRKQELQITRSDINPSKR